MADYIKIRDIPNSIRLSEWQRVPIPDINTLTGPVRIARKISSDNELNALRRIRDVIHDNIHGGISIRYLTEGISGIIEWIKDVIVDDISPGFEALYCRRESLFINLNENNIEFFNHFRDDFNYLNYFRQMIISLGYLHDLCQISHGNLTQEHIFFDMDFSSKIGGFGSAGRSDDGGGSDGDSGSGNGGGGGGGFQEKIIGQSNVIGQSVPDIEEKFAQDIRNLGNILRVMFVFLFENAQAIIQSRVYKPEEFKTFAYELFDGLSSVTALNAQNRVEVVRKALMDHYLNVTIEYNSGLELMDLL